MKKTLTDFILLFFGIVFFALPQPTFAASNGLPFLSYFAFIPVFLLVRRLSWKTVWLYGLLYGVGSYCFFTNWLATYHPMGMIVIAALYGFQFSLVFPLLKAAWLFWGKKGWLVQWLVWCAYEYIKTKGFAGFSYGVTAYSHWQLTRIIQCADIAGVWGLSALISFSSAWFSEIFYPFFNIENTENTKKKKTPDPSVNWLLTIKTGLHSQRISAFIWLAVFAAVLIYGFVAPKDYSAYNVKRLILLQTNTDPWVGGTPAYRRDLQTLQRLTNEALIAHPNSDFVVWPETAFVPRIRWHYRYRKNRERFELVDELLNYINSKDVPFILGNDDTVNGYTENGTYGEVSYNAVLLFRPKQNVIPPEPETYHKMHLVPFTEHFPFGKIFPKLYERLLNGDTHMWTKGDTAVIFNIDGLSFGSPICFEDTFGYIGRRYVQNGAQALVNLSNDAWSKSLACQNQHLSMAVFRSIENRVPLVRSTASGQTCIVDPNGKITAMLKPFTEAYLAGSIPHITNNPKTLYTRWGDYLAVFFCGAAGILFILGAVKRIFKSRSAKHHKTSPA